MGQIRNLCWEKSCMPCFCSTTSDAKEESFQGSSRTLMRKSSGGSDLKRKQNKSRSIKGGNRPSIVLSNDADMSTNLLKATSCSDVNKCSQMLDSSTHKAASSSVLKDSKFPEPQSGGGESEGISAMKVCTYNYCSIHGHRHSDLSPSNSFASMRRRMSKTEKSTKMESQSFHRAKRSSNTKKGMKPAKTNCLKDPAVVEPPQKRRAIRKMAAPKDELNGEGTHRRHYEDSSNSESVDENLHLYLKEKLQLSEFSKAERSVLEPCLLRDKSKEGIVASNSHKYVLPVDHPEHTNIILQKVGDPGECDMLPFDDIACTCHEEIPMGGRIHQDVNEDGISSLNFDVYKSGSKLNTSEATPSTSVAKKPIDKSRSLTTKTFVESRAINDMISPASLSEQLDEHTANCKEKNADPVQDRQFPMTDSEPDCNNPVGEKTQMEKQKHMGLWNLIYQHMVSGIASDDEKQPLLKKMDKEEQGEDSNTLPAMNNSDSCSDFCGVGQGMEVYDHDRGSHNIQLYLHNAIKLVKEAFDIILSEIPDHSSDDQSIAYNSDSDKGEKNHGASGELRMLAFSDSGKESMVQDLEEMRHKEYNINGPKRKEAQSNMVSKSKQQQPKSWSNLRKIIILKRFVKALEKVRNFNPWKSPHLPVQPGREADKIHLRHQTMEDRKTSEEGMLDCALQHVISKLAPAQKRKVALLFQAFETVNPLLEPGTSPRSNVAASSLASPVQTATASSYEKGSRKGKETNSGISLHKSSRPDIIYKDDQDQVSDSCTAKEGIPKSCSELNEPSSKSGSTHNAPSILTSEFTSISLKEHFGALNPDNSYHNYIAKDDDPDSISYRFVERGEATQTERVESSKTATAEDQNTLARIELILVQIEQRMLRVEQDISQMDALFQQIVSLLTSPAPQ
ncbi:calmodulin binding protein PICBP [Hevea brasiliensis]|uniref:calmodulin binding protein PICBP n=1 Tax=Hevea brasiliensis TaxID=3981 RepID=UPI0025DE678E|nr:calmodulin binding protein PICBP [Hevea brasiliensis]